MEQYIDLMSASATAGAQAVADTTLLLQLYLMGLVTIVGALIVAWCALTGLSYPERSQRAMAARLWERFGEACAADRAGCSMSYRGVYRLERKSLESGQSGQSGQREVE